jgi:hypothetical protein
LGAESGHRPKKKAIKKKVKKRLLTRPGTMQPKKMA